MSLFGRLFGKKSNDPIRVPAPLAPPAPDMPIYVIGDIHGRIDLLDKLLATIDAEVDGAPAHVLTVGDYVDRGEESAAVLARLYQRSATSDGRFICLLGNHEKMMLDFLADPEERGGRWLRNGGLQTLASYGVGQVTDTSGPNALRVARDALAKAFPAHVAGWLAARPVIWQSGTVVVAHAALDPAVSPDAQQDRTLLWGHESFLRQPRQDGLWVVHGHTVFDEPQYAASRISVDTGAYFTGRLTAAALSPDGSVRFLST